MTKVRKEQWKWIPGYVDLYAISSNGRIISFCKSKGRILCQKTSNYGYKLITFRKDGVLRTFIVHRLVAKAFVPNPHNKSIVNHINSNRADNRATNLEWCTSKENSHHSKNISKNGKVISLKKLKIIMLTLPQDATAITLFNIIKNRVT